MVQHSLNLILDREIKDSFSIVSRENEQFDTQALCRITYNRIFLIKEGRGALQVDDKVFPIAGNELFLLAKGQLFAFLPQTKISGYELCFGDCFWERTPASANNCKAVLFNNAAANQQIPVSEADYSEIKTVFHLIHLEFSKMAYPNQLDALAAYLKIVMIKIANINALLSGEHNSYEKELYGEFLQLVSKQYQTTHEVTDFADQLGISARKLSDLCKRCSGKGAKEIINGQLIAEAKRSLQFSSKPVKEIAFQLSFSNPGQFSHFFKKNTQTAPLDYRGHFVNIGM